MLSLLGIKKILVAVNKIDLIDYSEEKFNQIKNDYTIFLKHINIEPLAFIPVSARNGDNLIRHSEKTNWYKGKTIIEAIDVFEKEKDESEKAFRMFTQGIYKFNSKRIVAGSINSGNVKIGDEVIFFPSGKKSSIKSLETFSSPKKDVSSVGEAVGFTLSEELYIKPSELMCKVNETLPITTDKIKVNLFWLGKNNLMLDKEYKLKIGTHRTLFMVDKIEHVIDASEINEYEKRDFVKRNEVAQCILKTKNKISFDLITQIRDTSRFVIVDGYDIAGGGIIIDSFNDEQIQQNKYSDFEVELNQLIRKHFPHWNLQAITND